MSKLWGGRFTAGTDKKVDDFNSSISFDKRLYFHDIIGSIAHAEMLGKQGVIPADAAKQICAALQEILADIHEGKVEFRIDQEDIHMNVETLLTAKIGAVGKMLHTGRSRNDQVALDIRMYLKDEIAEICNMLSDLVKTVINIAENNLDTIMPGYTHLQRAQPVTLAHHMMAYCQMFRRDTERFIACYNSANILPLGSGALAGTTYPLDREYVAERLGFDGVTENSLDGVSDRDFAIEFISAASILMMHLSRFSEELVLWSSHEFGFVEMSDTYSTGSSIMPQKKNPDVAELVRGKTGRVYGDLMGLLTVMKGLPLAYNKDMQEDKEGVFDAIDTVKMCLPVFTGMLETCKFRKDNMYKASSKGFTNATDFADYIVKNGIPFRQAHAITGKLVITCISMDKGIDDLSLDEIREICKSELEDGQDPMEIFKDDLFDAITVEACVEGRSLIGGPAPATEKKAIEKASKWLSEIKIPQAYAEWFEF